MLQKLKLSIPLPLAVLIALISFLIGMSFGDVLPNFGNRLNPTPIPQMNVIHMIQTGFAQREIFRQDKEYNNCVGTETLERRYEQEKSSTVQYTLDVVGGLEIDVTAAKSQIEITVGQVEGETISEREELVDRVPAGSYHRYERRWFQVVAQGDIINDSNEVIGQFEAVVGLVFTETLNLLPCSNIFPSTNATPNPTPTSPNIDTTSNNSALNIKRNITTTGLIAIHLQTQEPEPTEEPYPSSDNLVERATAFQGNNADWIIVSGSFDDVEMVLVPVGCFQIGSTLDQRNYILSLDFGDSDTYWDELGGGTVCIQSPFWIDKNEVTNEQFDRLGGIAERPSFRRGDSLPRENINWYEAVAFCELRGGTLPTEAQWEFAARGPDAYIFPWGNEFDGNRVAYRGNEFQTVGEERYTEGASWVGAMHLSGNVWEWTTSLYALFPYSESAVNSGYYSIRGGSLFFDDGIHAANRAGGAPQQRNTLRGFRCVRAMQ